MTPTLVAVGGVGVLSGAVLFVLAFRRGQADDAAGERRTFRWAVTGLGAGSAVLLLALLTAPR